MQSNQGNVDAIYHYLTSSWFNNPKSACVRVDLPLPVLPTMPVLIPPRKVHVRPCNTSGMCGAYHAYITPISIS